MGGGIFDPGGTGTTQGEAPSPGGGTPTWTTGDPTYIKLVVPNFDGTSNPMGSFLRLGAVEPAPYMPGQPNPPVNGIDITRGGFSSPRSCRASWTTTASTQRDGRDGDPGGAAQRPGGPDHRAGTT